MESPSTQHPLTEMAMAMLVELCSQDSTSGRESSILKALLPMLERMGARVEVREPVHGRCNVLATWGEPKVLFSTHLDTVPPFIPPRVEGNRVYGRGSCDAKGQIVAQLLAIHSLLAQGKTGFAWLGVAGEETDSIGAQDAQRWKDRFLNCRALINGEPTELKLGTGQRGLESVVIRCKGQAAHSGSPELGRSAIADLLAWIQGIKSQPSPVDPHLGPEVWNLGIIQGGEAVNVIPAQAEARILARTVPGTTFWDLLMGYQPEGASVESILSEPWDRYPEIPGFDHAPMPFGSDAPSLRKLIPDRTVVLAGPGTIRVAHTDDEHIDLEDLTAGIELNLRLASHFMEDLP
ncbi:MAG: argE 2 [Holophagaceae bacterium]|nr:argE 2 [Holophagaceae bacterium]